MSFECSCIVQSHSQVGIMKNYEYLDGTTLILGVTQPATMAQPLLCFGIQPFP